MKTKEVICCWQFGDNCTDLHTSWSLLCFYKYLIYRYLTWIYDVLNTLLGIRMISADSNMKTNMTPANYRQNTYPDFFKYPFVPNRSNNAQLLSFND